MNSAERTGIEQQQDARRRENHEGASSHGALLS
jgi:hypothetical protein